MGRLRHEAGQTVVLFAILLPLLLGLGAIAVDVGYWYVVKKTAQDAADAAALAAARDLPDCEAAEEVGRAYGLTNMPDATVTPSCTTDDGGRVEVTVVANAETFFGRALGILSATVSQRAVAQRVNTPGNLAIFAHDEPYCVDGRGLEFDGENVSINGFVHSNSRFRISAGPFWAADGTISRNNCTSSIEQDVYSQFGDAPPLNREPRDVHETLPWPAWFTPAQFGWFSNCTYKGVSIEITARQVVITQPDRVIDHDGTVPSGTYCATDSFSVTGSGLHGSLTALAPSIAAGGNGNTFRPYSGSGVLFFAVPNSDFDPGNDGSLAGGGNPDCQPSPAGDMVLDGSGHRWRGVVFSPCGRVVVNMSDGNPDLEGVILAHQVKVDADEFSMLGRSDFEVQTALVE